MLRGCTPNDELTPFAVTVEHIFPRSPDAEWKVVSSADKDWDDKYVARLGNLCLLPGINHALGNKVFSKELEVYKKSSLNTTRKLEQYTTWGREKILARQKHMAQLAITAWRFQ